MVGLARSETSARRLEAAGAAVNALDHFGFLGFLLPMDSPASSEYTRQVLGWEPTGSACSRTSIRTTTTEPKFPDPS